MARSKNQKLVTILFADIVGYTALMEKGETAAMSTLYRFETITQKTVEKHQGEIIKTYGDGSLILFQNIGNAAQCAYEMQLAFRENPKVPLRIGIHLGEIIRKGKDIFGTSVNITSRIESMGIAGSVLLSKNAQEEIKDQANFPSQSLGVFEFKNIAQSMEVFALAKEGLVIPKQAEMQGKGHQVSSSKKDFQKKINAIAGILILVISGIFVWNLWNSKVGDTFNVSPTLDKSIAVLPFDNFNKDPEQQYFSDGISQDILTHLSGIKDLQVISFNSSRKYRTSEQSTQEIGQALGVQHLLSGSVQQSGKQFRIRARLINAVTDQQLWANSFDGELADIFQVQSEVSSKIAEVLKAELLPTVAARINAKPTENIAAWQEYSQGKHLWRKRGIENLLTAEKHFKKAITIDANFALAYAGLAQVYATIGIENLQYLDDCKQAAEKAIRLNPTIADAYAALGYYYRVKSDYANVIVNFEKALELEPGNATTHQWYSEALISKGDISAGRAHIEVAKKLDPESKIMQIMSAVYLFTEDKYTEGKNQLEAFYQESPAIPPIGYFLGVYYAKIGNYQKMNAIPAKHLWISEAEKQLLLYTNQQQLSPLKQLKSQTIQQQNITDKNAVLYKIDNEIMLLSGEMERYISRLDSSVFILGYETIDELQCFPPPDSIRLHPKFQEMMVRRGFTIRPQSAILEANKR